MSPSFRQENNENITMQVVLEVSFLSRRISNKDRKLISFELIHFDDN